MEALSAEFPDSGLYQLDRQSFLSTVDVVLPMTISPTDFGRVTVLHVLSDLYASGGLPKFALCFLGLPTGMSVDAPEAVMTLSGAVQELSAEGAVLVGGHTIIDQTDFFLGFAAFGVGFPESSLGRRQAHPGDRLIITKPLGSGIAISRWKSTVDAETDHADVLDGMLLSNGRAAELINNFPITACTDVTGYGLLGHLYNIMLASGTACRLSMSSIPIYDSVINFKSTGMSGQAQHNIEYVLANTKIRARIDVIGECALFDSEVSGGLLFSIHADQVDHVTSGLSELGYSPHVIGEVLSGPPGGIEIAE